MCVEDQIEIESVGHFLHAYQNLITGSIHVLNDNFYQYLPIWSSESSKNVRQKQENGLIF